MNQIMDFFKSLVKVIPEIDSVYKFISFGLLILAIVFVILLKLPPILRIVEKKLTKVQAYQFLKKILIGFFILALIIFGLVMLLN